MLVTGSPPVSELGVNFQAYLPAQGLSELGHYVDWVCPDDNASVYELPRPLNRRVRVFSLVPHPYLVWNPFVHATYAILTRLGILPQIVEAIDLLRSPGKFIPQLISHIARNQPDAIHTMPFPFSHCWLAAKAKRRAGVPLIISPYFNIGSPAYYSSFLRWSLRTADYVHVTTPAESAEIVRLGVGPSRVRLIPNAIDLSEWDRANGRRFRSKMGLHKQGIVLFPGRKEAGKGAILALKAMHRVLEHRANTVFLAAGHDTPAWSEALHAYHHDRVISLPYQSGIDRLDMFAAADIILLPSRADASPTVFLEAWALRKPVVGIRSRAAMDYVADTVDGLLAEVDNPSSLASVIEYLLDNEGVGLELGLNGRARVENSHDWKEVRYQYLKLYEDAVASFPGPS